MQAGTLRRAPPLFIVNMNIVGRDIPSFVIRCALGKTAVFQIEGGFTVAAYSERLASGAAFVLQKTGLSKCP